MTAGAGRDADPGGRRTHRSWLRAEATSLLARGSASACAKTAGVCREVLAVEASL